MMAKAPHVARILMGIVFVGAGITGLFQLAPPPEDLPEAMSTFMAGMMATTYFFPMLKLTETICGLLLISGFFVPLALVVLAPIILNIFMTHLFMAPDGLILATFLGVLEIYLAFFSPYKDAILPLFGRKLTS